MAAAFAAAAAFSWRKWPDLLADFGVQLYIPWRLSAGAVLYRDLFYIGGGPLSQYYNALLFKIFGVSFFTLIVSNLTLVALTLLLIYRWFLAAADVWTATIICLGIVLVFAFGQYVTTGNYNYAAPYSHEALHGLLLSILAVTFLSEWVKKERCYFAAAAGLCAGLVFLTKPDIFIALVAAVIAAGVLAVLTRRRMGLLRKSLAAFLLAGLIPPAAFFLFFLKVVDWRQSLRSVCFAWVPLLHPAITQDPYYRWCTGLDQPWSHLRQIFLQFFSVALAVAVYALIFRRVKDFKLKWITSPWVVVLMLIAPLLVWANYFNWPACGASLPLLALSACVLLCWNYRKLSPVQDVTRPLLWSVFALVLLSKLGLNARISHYGFVLAMPAFVSAVYLLLWLLPRLLESRFGVPGRFLRLAAGLVLLIGFVYLFNASRGFYQFKELPIGRGGDRILTFGPFNNPGTQVKAALAWMEQNTPPDATLAVVPEGILINYLARRVNPTPCTYWNTVIMTVLGQQNMIAAFERHPPDYIMLVARTDAEFGVGNFGRSPAYGLDLMQWVAKNYEPVFRVGAEPLQSGQFGIEILKRSLRVDPRFIPAHNLPSWVVRRTTVSTARNDRPVCAMKKYSPFPLTHKAMRALTEAVAKVVEDHRRCGRPVAVWCDGAAVWIPATEAGALRETPTPCLRDRGAVCPPANAAIANP